MANETMKTKLHSLFIGLAIIAGLHQATAQVTNLGIAPVAGGQSLLYWPAGSPTNNNYILQSTTNLAAPNWTTEKYPVPVTASTVSNTTPPSSSGWFTPIRRRAWRSFLRGRSRWGTLWMAWATPSPSA